VNGRLPFTRFILNKDFGVNGRLPFTRFILNLEYWDLCRRANDEESLFRAAARRASCLEQE
jgi:hypothetical protein